MVKILGISGSSRRGSTELALREALKAAEEVPGVSTDLWTVRGKKIGFCTHCDRCIRQNTTCHVQDDMKSLEPLFLAADGFIIASPVYDMNIPAQLAAVFNRLRPIYHVHPGLLKYKVGGAIALGGTRSGGQETTLQAILNFYLMHEMLVSGGVDGTYTGGKVWTQDKLPKDTLEDKVGLNTVRALGRAVGEATVVAALGRRQWDEEKKTTGFVSTAPVWDH